MEKIRSFRIKKLMLHGFKRFTDPAEFEFGEMTAITGHNAQGKSSIAEAITYAITGAPYFGGEKSLDRLYAMGANAMRVSLLIEIGGAAHELVRERVSDNTTITYDGVQIKQSDLNIMFGERDVFLSIFNPLYFIEELGDKGRNLLERCLPAVPHEDIMARLSADNRKLIEDSGMLSPEGILKQLGGEIRELGDNIIYAEGQRDLLKNQALDKQGMVKAKIAEYDMLSKNVDSARDLDVEISDTSQALEKRRAEQYVSKYAQSMADLSAKLEERGKKYRQEKAVYDGLYPGIQCPTCKREVTKEDLPDVKSAYVASINAIGAEGKELTQQLNELRALDTKAREVFGRFQTDDIAKLESQLAELQGLRESKTQLAALHTELETLIAKSAYNPADKDADIERMRKTISDKKNLETAVRFYISERVGLMFSGFDMLNRVSIQLYDVVKKTGEVKDVFKFTYDGRPYRYLSYSEKVKAGLEISALLKKLTDSEYPVFIDNGESVPVIDNIRQYGQLIFSQVVKGKPLTVTMLGATAQKAA